MVDAAPTRSIWWESDAANAANAATVVIDQRALPDEVVLARWTTLADAVSGIADMTVRGAPLIGVAAAHGMALAARVDASDGALADAAGALAATRPTAVNLFAALQGARDLVAHVAADQRAAALQQWSVHLADADAAACRAIGEVGLAELDSLARGGTLQILTHCNAGRLACIEWGTATAPVYLAHRGGRDVHVWVSETRPRNQGASLTAWELAQAGVPHTLVVDNAAGHLLASGAVHAVIVGADRVAANGDTANKIGTSLKAYAAAVAGVPFYVAMPWSSFDPATASGAQIPIEERSVHEVLELGGRRLAPTVTPARNWGFDVTPARFITAFFTPTGVLRAEELLEACSAGTGAKL